jgi:hypothetical protein
LISASISRALRFEEDAPQARHHHLAEGRVSDGADDHLAARQRHLLYQHTLDRRCRVMRARVRRHLLEGGAHGGLVGQTEGDAAHIRLVADGGR